MTSHVSSSLFTAVAWHTMKLQITQSGQVVWVHRVEASAVCVGRSASADIQLDAPDISGHHALLYVESGVPFVRDLGSTNGTFIDDRPVTQPVAVAIGTVVRLGSDVGLTFVESDAQIRQWHLCPVGGLVGWPIDRSPWPVPDTGAVLRVDDESVWLQVGDDWTAIVPDEPFRVGAVDFVLRASGPRVETVRPGDLPLPYEVRVSLTRTAATVTSPAATVQFRGANQVALLYVLGRARLDGNPWVSDATLLAGVWGRSHASHTTNNLHVLLHRVRKPVERAGLDAGFLERRVGETRLHVVHVLLDD